jgi:hypothetical protein
MNGRPTSRRPGIHFIEIDAAWRQLLGDIESLVAAQ